jgi:hypothetical protein
MSPLFWRNMIGVRFMIGIPEVPTDAEIARVLLFLEPLGDELVPFMANMGWVDDIAECKHRQEIDEKLRELL